MAEKDAIDWLQGFPHALTDEQRENLLKLWDQHNEEDRVLWDVAVQSLNEPGADQSVLELSREKRNHLLYETVRQTIDAVAHNIHQDMTLQTGQKHTFIVQQPIVGAEPPHIISQGDGDRGVSHVQVNFHTPSRTQSVPSSPPTPPISPSTPPSPEVGAPSHERNTVTPPPRVSLTERYNRLTQKGSGYAALVRHLVNIVDRRRSASASVRPPEPTEQAH